MNHRNDRFGKEMLPLVTRVLDYYYRDHWICFDELDWEEGADLSCVRPHGHKPDHVAVRVRRWTCPYRDFTIRDALPSGHITELQKLIEGHCADVYLYCWEHNLYPGLAFKDWMLIDIPRLRASGLLQETHPGDYNPDGTHWCYVKWKALVWARAIKAICRLPIQKPEPEHFMEYRDYPYQDAA